MFQACQRPDQASRGVPRNLKGRTFIVNGQELSLKKFISEGSYARVYRTSDPRISAKYMRVQSAAQIRVVKRECHALRLLRQSEHCLHAIAMFFDDEALNEAPPSFSEAVIFMEFCEAPLQELIQGRLTEDEILDIFEGIVLGVSELHSVGMIHRDLKVENVLLAQRRASAANVRICDFGSVSDQRFTGRQIAQDARLMAALENEF